MAANKPKFTPEEVSKALAKCRGLVFKTAEQLKCSARTVERYIANHECCREARDQQRGKNLDRAEDKLLSAIDAGEAWAICFFLKTQGKARGYVEKQQIEHDGRVAQMQVVEEIVVSRDAAKADTPAPDPGGVPPV